MEAGTFIFMSGTGEWQVNLQWWLIAAVCVSVCFHLSLTASPRSHHHHHHLRVPERWFKSPLSAVKSRWQTSLCTGKMKECEPLSVPTFNTWPDRLTKSCFHSAQGGTRFSILASRYHFLTYNTRLNKIKADKVSLIHFSSKKQSNYFPPFVLQMKESF